MILIKKAYLWCSLNFNIKPIIESLGYDEWGSFPFWLSQKPIWQIQQAAGFQFEFVPQQISWPGPRPKETKGMSMELYYLCFWHFIESVSYFVINYMI